MTKIVYAMSALKLNTSYKHHTLVALIISCWLVVFLILIAPFDAADLSFIIRLQILPFYGVISFLSYIILVPLQNMIFRNIGRWTIALEIGFVVLFNLFALLGSYSYYKTDIINGTYPFSQFTLEVYYPIFFILLIILVFARWYLNKKAPTPTADTILLRGANKLDILRISLSDLVSISSADNYIQVNYLKDDQLRKKLLRTTLKEIHVSVPDLLKVHRSYLINPIHFKEWKDSTTVNLTQMEVPVSKKYKKVVLALDHSPLKRDSSSQSQ